MPLYPLLAIPAGLVLASLAMPGRRSLLAIHGCGLGALLVFAIRLLGRTADGSEVLAARGFFRADVLSAWMTVVVGIVALAAGVYSTGYMDREIAAEPDLTAVRRGRRLGRFFALFDLFVGSMLFVCIVDNLGYLWVGIEATTMVSVFLVGYYRRKEAVEAAWKYLILCSVGIAFALVGTILIYYTSVRAAGPAHASLSWSVLASQAPTFHPYLMKLAFVFVLVGFGTKAGLAPLHAWLPDAHSEAPTPVSALLSGVLLKCAIYGVLRYHILSIRCQGPAFSEKLLLLFGGFSILLAALFILVQRNVKRLLAYHSLEHIGIIATGFGFGGLLGAFGGLFHILNHALTKSVMFLTAGRIAERHGTKDMERIRGVGESQPVTGALFFGGAMALAGMPLTSIFLSELYILRAGFAAGRIAGVVVMLAGLAVVFGGLVSHVMRMLLGSRRLRVDATRDPWDAVVPPAFLLILVLALGVTIPEPVAESIGAASRLFRP